MWSKLIQFPVPTPSRVQHRKTGLKDLLGDSVYVKVCQWCDIKHLRQEVYARVKENNWAIVFVFFKFQITKNPDLLQNQKFDMTIKDKKKWCNTFRKCYQINIIQYNLGRLTLWQLVWWLNTFALFGVFSANKTSKLWQPNISCVSASYSNQPY